MIRVLVALVGLVACEREERPLQQPAAAAALPTLAPQATVVPGEDPKLGDTFDFKLHGYRETAYAISEGNTLYHAFNCVGCHQHGGGGMGPALMDERWIYGSAPVEVATSIIAGRPNGMPSYRGKIALTQLYQLVAFVRSLGNLVRGDAQPAREDHIKLAPAPTLYNKAIPLPGKERP
jgi:cytochrome c oxidase cbb3-type subunit III